LHLHTPYQFDYPQTQLCDDTPDAKMGAQYMYGGSIDHTIQVNRSQVEGKTVIITGGMYHIKYVELNSNLTSGANGIGAEYAKAMAAAGYVCLFYLFAVFMHHCRG